MSNRRTSYSLALVVSAGLWVLIVAAVLSATGVNA